ncbi:MAG: hypothetical protein ACOCWZ_03355 [Spirochaetota bacterium]
MKKILLIANLCVLVFFSWATSHAEQGDDEILKKIAAFRQTLSQQEENTIRRGNMVNKQALADKILEFGRNNKSHIIAYQEKMISRMEKKAMPSEDDYTRVCIADAAGNEGFLRMVTLYSILNPDPGTLALFYAGTLLPPVLQNRQMQMDEITGWLSFFSFAAPAWYVSDKNNDRMVINGFYGNRDVLTFKFTRNKMVWVPAMMYWWQKK